MTDRPVGIRAVGLCTPLGRDLDATWARLAAGHDGFVDVDRFDLTGLPTRCASAFDAAALDALCAEADQRDPALAFAVLAGRDAVAALGPEARARVALIAATSAGAADTHEAYDRSRHGGALDPSWVIGGAFTSFADAIATALGLGGPRTTVSTACASGGHAIGLATDLLRSGAADRALVVASDAVYPLLFAGFHAVGALATGPCTPFGERFGMSLGEGAGALLLEVDPPSPLAWVHGWGGSCDAYHPTAPDPQGHGMARALVAALADADVPADAVGAYNAHGTGTEANDPAETFAVRAVFGDRLPVSASKSQFGHTQGAAGAIEAIVTAAGLRAQAVPPTLRCLPPRRIAPADPVAGGRARPHPHELAVSASAAFGGTNVALVLGRGRPAARGPRVTPIYALGAGTDGPFGAIGTALDPGSAVVPVAPSRVGPRRADPCSATLTRAMAAAAADAGLPSPADRVGTVVGMANGPQQSIRQFVDSRNERGLAHTSAAAFARMVFNAPAGAAATTLQLRGTNLTLWSGHGSGAQAVLVGARLLAEHPELDAVMAAAADEDGYLARDRYAVGLCPAAPIEAAGAIVLGRTPGHARLAGSAWGPADRAAEVVAEALAGHRPDRVIVSLAPGFESPFPHPATFDVDRAAGHAAAASGALASAAAIAWIRSGSARSALVVSVSPDPGCTALWWVHPGLEGAP